jgi:hypothetical protein
MPSIWAVILPLSFMMWIRSPTSNEPGKMLRQYAASAMEEDCAHVEQTWYKIGTAAQARAVTRICGLVLYQICTAEPGEVGFLNFLSLYFLQLTETQHPWKERSRLWPPPPLHTSPHPNHGPGSPTGCVTWSEQSGLRGYGE